jgi:hypothetical protein
VLTEGESDATVAAYLIEALALRDLAWAAGATKGAAARPERALLREVVARGVKALLLIPDLDPAGEEWGRAWTSAARELGLAAATFDLLERGLVSPSLGGKDLRDAYRRQPARVMAELKAAVETLGEGEEFVSFAFKSGSLKETKFRPASELLAQSETFTEWVLHSYLPRGGVALLSSRPKVGKTTLTAHAVKALLEGSSFLGAEAALDGRVAWLSEEPPALFADRLRSLGLADDRLLVCFRHQSHGRALVELVAEAFDLGATLVVVDTVAAWAGIEDENSATEVEAALRPVINLVQEKGACLLLLHHLNKSDGPEGTAHRGSGHLVAMVDVAIELRRPEGNAPQGRRMLRALSRYHETPQELVIELGGEGYIALGTGEEVSRQQAERALLDVLPGPSEEPIAFEGRGGEDTVVSRLAELRLGRTTLHQALVALVERGQVERHGLGKRGDPYRYRLAPHLSFPSNSQVLVSRAKETETDGRPTSRGQEASSQATPEGPSLEAPTWPLALGGVAEGEPPLDEGDRAGLGLDGGDGPSPAWSGERRARGWGDTFISCSFPGCGRRAVVRLPNGKPSCAHHRPLPLGPDADGAGPPGEGELPGWARGADVNLRLAPPEAKCVVCYEAAEVLTPAGAGFCQRCWLGGKTS